MWVLPKQLIISAFVPDTEALISDLSEQSQACAQSLIVRSKPSPVRTWLQKWKRDSWTQHLSGRILKPSHGQIFMDLWTSSLADIHVSHSVQQANDSDQKTTGISGPLSQQELQFADQEYASLKMSKVISRWDSPLLSATWKKWVMKCRGEYSQRLKSARLISGNESSSSLNYPTPNTCPEAPNRSSNTKNGPKNIYEAIDWPTVTTAEAGKIPNQRNYGQIGLSNHPAIRGELVREKSKKSCRSNQDEILICNSQSEWPTATARDHEGCGNALPRKDGRERMDTLEAVVIHGRADQANSSTHGNHQELWLTPRANEPNSDPNFAKRNGDRGEHCHGMLISQANPSDRNNGKLNPRWVETLMGLPIGWTMPSCTHPAIIVPTNLDCLETE